LQLTPAGFLLSCQVERARVGHRHMAQYQYL